MSKPTLQDIADMPHTAALKAVRKHYDPLWGRLPAPDGEPRLFKVEMEWEVTESGTFVTKVTAGSEKEAEMLANEEFERQHYGDYEVLSVQVAEALQ